MWEIYHTEQLQGALHVSPQQSKPTTNESVHLELTPICPSSAPSPNLSTSLRTIHTLALSMTQFSPFRKSFAKVVLTSRVLQASLGNGGGSNHVRVEQL